MEYLVSWKEKGNSNIKRFVGVRDYGAKLICDLLKENGYQYTCEETPKPIGKKRLGKVVIDIGYVVDLDNEGMVGDAKDALYEDVMNAVKFNEVDCWIKVIDAPDAKEEDIPEFLANNEERDWFLKNEEEE